MKMLKEDIENIGAKLAYMHNQPILNFNNMVRLDGCYLFEKSRILNMPFHMEIGDALKKIDVIINRILNSIPNPFTRLWNQCQENPNINNFYGNPAWDLGIVINAAKSEKRSESFLRRYLEKGGVPVTIIELYTGILHAKLDAAISNQCADEWERLAKNECKEIISGKGPDIKEISCESIALLGLSGMYRI